MEPKNLANSPPAQAESVPAPQNSPPKIKPQNLPAQPSSSNGVSRGSRLIAVESVASNPQSFNISVKIDATSPPPALHSPNTVEIEAVDLSYKAPTAFGLVKKLSWSASDGKPNSSPAFIVRNVSFTAKSSELLAIVGPSGAGKSTLLDLLAGKLRPSSPPDSILINRQPMDKATFRRISGYVPQSDALFPHLSVRETFLFSAHVRLPASVSSTEKREKVDALLNELKLMHVADMRVGSEDVRGISGGEKRRVSIGVDVIHDPVVLLLDEPTSGLDSASALHVIEMLRSMAKTRSRTIILSIHQPSYRIIQQIHSFLLLADGHAVHHGSVQHLHYKLIAEGHKIPPQVNILEYAIEDIASKQSMAAMDESDTGLKGCNTMHLHEKEHKTASRIMSDTTVHHEKAEQAYQCQVSCKAKLAAPAFANNSVREIMFLSQRFARNVFRTYELFTARTMQAIFVGLALGLLYIHVGTNVRGVVERMGFFAFTLTFLLSSSVEALPISLQERPVFMRETTRGAYRISSYLMANFIVFLPFLLMIALLYSVPVYWLVELSNQPSAFCFFVFVVWLVLLMADAFVAFLSTLVPNYIIGNTMITGCLGTFFLFSGYFISEQDMPPYFRFLHYISLFKYPLDALLINEYTSLGGKCFGMAIAGDCTFKSEDVLTEVGLDGSSKWTKLLVMVFFICLYRAMGYAVLQYKLYKISR